MSRQASGLGGWRAARAARRAPWVAGGEVDAVGSVEARPVDRVVATRLEPVPDRADRPLPVPVQDRQGAPGRLLAVAASTCTPCTPSSASPRRERSATSSSPSAVISVALPAIRASCVAATPPPPAGLLEAAGGVHDLAGRRDVIAPDELDPLDVSHHGCAHRGNRQRLTPTTAMHR